jgi:hypothetical protein
MSLKRTSQKTCLIDKINSFRVKSKDYIKFWLAKISYGSLIPGSSLFTQKTKQ